MKKDLITLVAVGDVSPRREQNPESLFALNTHVIREADIAFCQLECTYSERGSRQVSLYRYQRHPASNVSSLKSAGFDVVSFASNHCLDWGEEAFFDTIDLLKQNDLLVVGAGKDIYEARKPVIVERKGTRVAFLAYNSALPQGYAAAYDRPGCAPIRVITAYAPDNSRAQQQPGSPARTITLAYHDDLEAMREDIDKARNLADIVVVSQHAGVPFIPALIAMYQKEIAHTAIDAGADLVLQHHAHILRGIEVYKGKAVFYGLCNWAHESPRGLMKDTSDVQARLKETNVKVDPEWILYPFNPESRNTIMVKAQIANKQLQKVSFLPCLINKQVQAEILLHSDKRSQDVLAYIEDISRDQGLDIKFSWEGDEISVC